MLSSNSDADRLTAIFRHLDCRTLVSCSLTCKRWDALALPECLLRQQGRAQSRIRQASKVMSALTSAFWEELQRDWCEIRPTLTAGTTWYHVHASVLQLLLALLLVWRLAHPQHSSAVHVRDNDADFDIDLHSHFWRSNVWAKAQSMFEHEGVSRCIVSTHAVQPYEIMIEYDCLVNSFCLTCDVL